MEKISGNSVHRVRGSFYQCCNALLLLPDSKVRLFLRLFNFDRGRKALEAAEKVLQEPEMAGLELYCFRAIAKGSVLDVRLDKVACSAAAVHKVYMGPERIPPCYRP
jgi:hypothetical protein